MKTCWISSVSVNPHGSAELSGAWTTRGTESLALGPTLAPALSLVRWGSLVGVN